jgi:hypothetical protein
MVGNQVKRLSNNKVPAYLLVYLAEIQLLLYSYSVTKLSRFEAKGAVMDDPTARIAILEAQLRDLQYRLRQTDQRLIATFKLSPQRMKLMGLLLTLPIVTPEVITRRLGINIEVRVAMNRLRKDLAKFEIPLESRRKLGYWFSDETKLKIKAMTAAQEASQEENAL